MFAIYGSDGTVNDPEDYLFHVDDFTMKFDTSLATTDIVQQNEEISIYPNPFTDFLQISNAKNINKIELLPQERSLLSNTTSWLVLQSFHPLLAGFFF